MSKRSWIIVLLALVSVCAWSAEGKQPKKELRFFYRTGRWVDNFLLQDMDTAFIGLPDHSWRVAFTSGMLGINSSMHSRSVFEAFDYPLKISMYNRTTPSVDLGFNVGFRGFGFGYSWDALHAYAQKLNFSFGSKYIGVDFSYQKSTNIRSQEAVNDARVPTLDVENGVIIRNANLNIWYALNSSHYSHEAVMKQSYIQRKTAGSLMVHLSYMSSNISLSDTMLVKEAEMPTLPAMMSGVRGMTTRQIAVGVGYGINYTPNEGKVVLHASAAAMLVCYSVNHVEYHFPDSIQSQLPGDAMFTLHSAKPVHMTGNVRAAVSWEINEWVHLAAWAMGENIRFTSEKTANNNVLTLSNWNWKVQLVVGVRFGAGKARVQRALGDPKITPHHLNHDHLPRWLTDYFWSP